MAPTLRDVAQRAGVSTKTVSNVLNGHPHVRASTRERVEQAIESLGYRPNLTARQLKFGRSGFWTLAIPQIDSPYFAELAARFTDAATRRGYVLLLDVTRSDPATERAVLSGTQPQGIDGLIFSPLSLKVEEIEARTDDTPVVFLGECDTPHHFDHVQVDSFEASFAMTSHLIESGRTRIAAIGVQPNRGTSTPRLAGYREALRYHGLPQRTAWEIGVERYEWSDGQLAMTRLLQLPDRPEAVFCFNDEMAIGALRACRTHGLDVPGDIAVAGFDDIAEASFSAPSLTTVAPDLDRLVDETVRLLVSRVEGTRDIAERVIVPWRLVIRESTAGL